MKDSDLYVGYTKDLKNRISEHNEGKVPSTKNRTPFDLIYYEACINQQDALNREKYLKTSWGKRYIKNRLKNYLTGQKADDAESKKDFIHKISICKKEARESKHWLRMISTASPELKSKTIPLWKEAKELNLIFNSIIISCKKKK